MFSSYPAVKLPLHVGLIKIDPFGQGKLIRAAFLFRRIEGLPVTSQQAEWFVIGFDPGYRRSQHKRCIPRRRSGRSFAVDRDGTEAAPHKSTRFLVGRKQFRG